MYQITTSYIPWLPVLFKYCHTGYLYLIFHGALITTVNYMGLKICDCYPLNIQMHIILVDSSPAMVSSPLHCDSHQKFSIQLIEMQLPWSYWWQHRWYVEFIFVGTYLTHVYSIISIPWRIGPYNRSMAPDPGPKFVSSVLHILASTPAEPFHYWCTRFLP